MQASSGKYVISRTGLLNVVQLLIIVLLFSYDFKSYISNDATSVVISLMYYTILLVLYVIYFLIYLRTGIVYKYNNRDMIKNITLLFLVFYFVRLVVDLLIKNVHQEIYTHNYTGVFLFANSVILPFLVISVLDVSKLNWIKVQKFCGMMLMLCLLYSFWHFIKNPEEYVISDGRVDTGILDTISFGHMGVSAFLFGLFLYGISNNKQWRILYIAIMGLGIVVAFLAGSRGPIVALITCILFFIIAKKKWTLFVGTLLAICVVFLLYQPINTFLMDTWGIFSLQRFYDTLFTMDNADSITSGRDSLYAMGLKHIGENLMFGYSFVENGKYVHNSVLEAFMATGVVGGTLFIIMLVATLLRTVKLMLGNNEYIFFALIAVQYIVFSMFSRSLTILPVLWLMLFIVNKIYITSKSF